MGSLLLFIPDELIPLLLVGAGLALIFGARMLSCRLIKTVLALAILPVLLSPLFDAMPAWALTVLLGVLIVAVLLSLLRGTSAAFIGRTATDHLVGSLAADAVRAVFVGSFRVLGRIIRPVLRSLARLFGP